MTADMRMIVMMEWGGQSLTRGFAKDARCVKCWTIWFKHNKLVLKLYSRIHNPSTCRSAGRWWPQPLRSHRTPRNISWDLNPWCGREDPRQKSLCRSCPFAWCASLVQKNTINKKQVEKEIKCIVQCLLISKSLDEGKRSERSAWLC